MKLKIEEDREREWEQGVREAMLAVGESGSHIQLLAPLNSESTIAKFLDRSGPGPAPPPTAPCPTVAYAPGTHLYSCGSPVD